MSSGRSSELPKAMPFAPGSILAGKYRVERLLGQGGMGCVVVATHVQLEQRVALKFMHAPLANDAVEAVARFLREARAAARIQSEHVARVSDFGTLENGAPYLVMEYLEGEDLESLLRTRGALPTDVVVDYTMQACEGLAEAHAAGIVHRDLKPANLFLARRSDGSARVKLLDFGISKLSASGGARDAAMTSTQALMGSPLYMSPEQMRSSKSVDGRADLWSMGVILYEMLAGRPPFDGETLPLVCARILTEAPPPLRGSGPAVHDALEAVVLRCLEKEPRDRYQDVAALALAIAPFGGPGARVLATRIGRIARGRAVSLSDVAVDEPAAPGAEPALTESGHTPPRPVAASKGIVQTRAEFSHTGDLSPPRRGARLAALGGAAVFVVAAAALGVVATRGRSKVEVPSSASAAGLPPVARAAPAAPETPTTTPPGLSTIMPADAPLAHSPETASSPSAVGNLGQPVQRLPRAKPAASTKPAGTAAFGGRD